MLKHRVTFKDKRKKRREFDEMHSIRIARNFIDFTKWPQGPPDFGPEVVYFKKEISKLEVYKKGQWVEIDLSEYKNTQQY